MLEVDTFVLAALNFMSFIQIPKNNEFSLICLCKLLLLSNAWELGADLPVQQLFQPGIAPELSGSGADSGYIGK